MRLIEWLGSVMVLVALIDFIHSPRAALESITDTLNTNVHISQNGKFGLRKMGGSKGGQYSLANKPLIK